MVQHFADNSAEYGVSQELEPFVGRQPVIGSRGVRQAVPQQVAILEAIVERCLAMLQHLIGEIAFPSPRHDRSHESRTSSRHNATDYPLLDGETFVNRQEWQSRLAGCRLEECRCA